MNRQKYVMDESMDSVLDQFYRSLNETLVKRGYIGKIYGGEDYEENKRDPFF